MKKLLSIIKQDIGKILFKKYNDILILLLEIIQLIHSFFLLSFFSLIFD